MSLMKNISEALETMANVWCPNCRRPQRYNLHLMRANALNDHDAADLLCAECFFVIATFHAEATNAKLAQLKEEKG